MATTRLNAFTDEQVAYIRTTLESIVGADSFTVGNKRNRNLQASRVVIGILTDSVAATTGLTTKPKVGTLNIYGFTSTGTTDTGIDEKCYNFAPQAATTDRWTVCERDAMTGKLIITTQFCS